MFCYAFVKADDSAVFADSAAPSSRPIFGSTFAKVDDSADSANIDCVAAAHSMTIPLRPSFCRPIENEATSLFMSGDSADSADSAATSRRLIFCNTFVKVVDSADSATFDHFFVSGNIFGAGQAGPKSVLPSSPCGDAQLCCVLRIYESSVGECAGMGVRDAVHRQGAERTTQAQTQKV